MSGIEEIPSTSRAMGYSYGQSSWKSIAVQTSGEVKIARGETLIQQGCTKTTENSGGVALGSGPCERVILRIPEIWTSGPAGRYSLFYTNSGLPCGVMVGGKSGNEPCFPNILSGLAFNLASGRGLWLPPGSQKELYVQNINEIYVAGTPSGYPVTWVGEVIA
jgi:hypothetical protein